MQNPQGPSEPSTGKVVKRKHRIKEILLGFLLLVVLVMITPAVLSLFFKDIPPVSAPDLALTKVTVPVADNAYFDMLKVQNAAVEIPQLGGDQSFFIDVLAGRTWDQAVVDNAITKNAEALGYFADAAKKQSYQFPGFADPANIGQAVYGYDSALSQWNISRTAVLYSLNLQKQGKEQEAFQQALNILHVGKIIQQSQTPLMGYVVGSNLKILAMQTLQILLANTKLPKEQLTQYSAQVQDSSTTVANLANAFKLEHASSIRLFNEDNILNDPVVRDEYSYLRGIVYWRAWVPRSYYYQPNKIIKQWDEIDRAALAVATRPCPQIDQPLVPHSYKFTGYQLAFWLRLYFLPNAIGQFYNELAFISTGSIWQKRCNEDALNSVTQTLITLKEFSQDNGALPVALTQLVPTYLPAVPLDPYDGKAIKYSAEKKIIYSIGNDHVDNGGSTGDDWQKMADPTFPIQ